MKQRQFLQVVDRDEAERRFRAALDPLPDLGGEQVAIADALGRILAEDVISEVDVPGFDRSNMDGWAVRASDTFGASEHNPLILKQASTSVRIGELSKHPLHPGEAMPIPTGGAVPRGANAVLLVEATTTDGDQVRVLRAVTTGRAISFAGSDVAAGETVLVAGEILTSRETGVLAAIGCTHVSVRRRPSVAIISTGDELRPPGEPLIAGQIHDANARVLADATREHGGVPSVLGIVRDDAAQLEAKLREAIAQHDVVLLSGGTSKGPGDLTVTVLDAVLEPPGVVVHGIALKPGKPVCLAVSGRVPVVVLPGFPTSAIFTFHELVAPLLRDLSGHRGRPQSEIDAQLPFRFRSDPGRTEYCMVHLVRDESDQCLAYPIRKGSGSITTWSQADGYFVVPRHTEHVEAGSVVKVRAMAGVAPRLPDLVVMGSHCVGVELLLAELRRRGYDSKMVTLGSEGGLAAAARGACDVAPIHLFDADTDEYNTPFIPDGVELIAGYGRQQCVIYRPGDPRFEGKDATSAVREAAQNDVPMINRNRGSGTRALYDRLLGDARPPGYDVEASSHTAVAAAVVQERADFGIAIDVVAADRNLGILPLQEERLDFAVPSKRRSRPAVQTFVELLRDESMRAALLARGLRP